MQNFFLCLMVLTMSGILTSCATPRPAQNALVPVADTGKANVPPKAQTMDEWAQKNLW